MTNGFEKKWTVCDVNHEPFYKCESFISGKKKKKIQGSMFSMKQTEVDDF